MTRKQFPLFPDSSDGDAPGTSGTPWRKGWQLSEEKVDFFRERAVASRVAKEKAMRGEGEKPIHPINEPRLDLESLMPRLPGNGLASLSLFSGGGGLDLGFDLAGFAHVASYDWLDVAGETLKGNRPDWAVFAGPEAGDVSGVDWSAYKGAVDVLHGGPPCQPFSSAGRQLGSADGRDMFPQFVRAVLECAPRAFVAENVTGLQQAKFQQYLEETVLAPLRAQYHLIRFELKAEWFGVPQIRTRLFLVGFRGERESRRFRIPAPTHHFGRGETRSEGGDLFGLPSPAEGPRLSATMGVREALGLPATGYDNLAPTLRSGFTGPRGATSVNSSVSALNAWGRLGVWPNGVAANREAARLFVPENGHFRLSVLDAALLQGFPESWRFAGPVYAILGQIGNSVAPPMGYRVALAVADALSPKRAVESMPIRR